jgi:hypothetical protein
MKLRVRIGITTLVGYLVAIAGLLPVIIDVIEDGTKAAETLSTPDEIAALVGIIALGITQIGRYWQAAILDKRGGPGA